MVSALLDTLIAREVMTPEMWFESLVSLKQNNVTFLLTPPPPEISKFRTNADFLIVREIYGNSLILYVDVLIRNSMSSCTNRPSHLYLFDSPTIGDDRWGNV